MPLPLTIRYLGQEGFRLSDGVQSLVIDPYLSDSLDRLDGYPPGFWRRNYAPPVRPADLGDTQLVLCSHDHLDHADPETLTAIARAAPSCRFAGPTRTVALFHAIGIAPDRTAVLDAGRCFERGHVVIEPNVEPLVLGPAVVPEITDPAVAGAETERAVLSAVAHGNGPNGLTVVQAALVALGRLDQEHAMVYFQLIWNGLREPMRQALEALVMERQIEGEATFPPFVQTLLDRGKLEGLREGELKGLREGKLEGLREGELKGKRDTLLRLLACAGIVLAENDIARILACTDIATLDRWIDNVLGAKTVAEVLS